MNLGLSVERLERQKKKKKKILSFPPLLFALFVSLVLCRSFARFCLPASRFPLCLSALFLPPFPSPTLLVPLRFLLFRRLPIILSLAFPRFFFVCVVFLFFFFASSYLPFFYIFTVCHAPSTLGYCGHVIPRGCHRSTNRGRTRSFR